MHVSPDLPKWGKNHRAVTSGNTKKGPGNIENVVNTWAHGGFLKSGCSVSLPALIQGSRLIAMTEIWNRNLSLHVTLFTWIWNENADLLH